MFRVNIGFPVYRPLFLHRLLVALGRLDPRVMSQRTRLSLGFAGTSKGGGGSGAGAGNTCPKKPIGINPITGKPIYSEPSPFGPIYYGYRPDGSVFSVTPFPPADT